LYFVIIILIAECNSEEFRCRSGLCIEASKRCNFSPDCPDGDDEGEDCRKYFIYPSKKQTNSAKTPIQLHTHTHQYLYINTYYNLIGRQSQSIGRLCVN